jgi:hypothetical protein
MSDEPKPALFGTYYGELSPGGQWFWNGTGTPEDRWIANPDIKPEPLVNPTLAKAHVQTMAVMDFANQNKFTLPGLPGSLTWTYIGQCWAVHDIIRVAGLT